MLFASLLALASFQDVPAAAAQTVPAGPETALTITVQKLPPSFKQNPLVSISFNGKGAVASCETKTSSGHLGIDKVACAQLIGNYSVEPVKGEKPAPVDVFVAFEVDTKK